MHVPESPSVGTESNNSQASFPDDALGQIQGNILGFNKPHQCFLFLRFNPRWRADIKHWLDAAVKNVTSVHVVEQGHKAHKEANNDAQKTPPWCNIAFTYAGLVALGKSDIKSLPDEFKVGMAGRDGILGDTGKNAPANWVFNTHGKQVHALVILAHDDKGRLQIEVAEQIARFGRGVRLIHLQEGYDPPKGDLHGVEHFGFKDGKSQPDVKRDGIVIGYGGGSAEPVPEWTKFGSYLVFRRLSQNVPGFWLSMKEHGDASGLSDEELAAKLIGRSSDGMELLEADMPPGAHIRKVNPPSEGGKTRILRRGIPFGERYNRDAAKRDAAKLEKDAKKEVSFPNDRGLLFICYQESIKNQFEVLQGKWANDHKFPLVEGISSPGQDPIIGQGSGDRKFKLPGVEDAITLDSWVTMTGGDYFFSPSISVLHELSEVGLREEEIAPATPLGRYLSVHERVASNQINQLGGFVASGRCTVQISVAAADLAPRRGKNPRLITWEIAVGDREDQSKTPEIIWRSNAYTGLVVNAQGIAIGSAQVSVRKLLEALVLALPDTTLEEILEIITPEWIRKNPEKAYRYFYLRLYVQGKNPIPFPIDMGAGGHPY